MWIRRFYVPIRPRSRSAYHPRASLERANLSNPTQATLYMSDLTVRQAIVPISSQFQVLLEFPKAVGPIAGNNTSKFKITVKDRWVWIDALEGGGKSDITVICNGKAALFQLVSSGKPDGIRKYDILEGSAPAATPSAPPAKSFQAPGREPGARARHLMLAGAGAIALAVLIGAPAHANDWPQWRGPTRSGHAPMNAPTLSTLPREVKPVWKITVGGGHAGGSLGWIHLGLGTLDAAEVQVTWPDGNVGPWQTIPAGGFAILRRDAEPEPWLPD
ncbi:MAG: hypothetical protein HC933_15585 [Pleurocapsa sp. SU_196_0]|nr:hypothetical protein [Pleurocapsa sp. SU_196_0]